jgi:hypothetical protein
MGVGRGGRAGKGAQLPLEHVQPGEQLSTAQSVGQWEWDDVIYF